MSTKRRNESQLTAENYDSQEADFGFTPPQVHDMKEDDESDIDDELTLNSRTIQELLKAGQVQLRQELEEQVPKVLSSNTQASPQNGDIADFCSQVDVFHPLAVGWRLAREIAQQIGPGAGRLSARHLYEQTSTLRKAIDDLRDACEHHHFHLDILPIEHQRCLNYMSDLLVSLTQAFKEAGGESALVQDSSREPELNLKGPPVDELRKLNALLMGMGLEDSKEKPHHLGNFIRFDMEPVEEKHRSLQLERRGRSMEPPSSSYDAQPGHSAGSTPPAPPPPNISPASVDPVSRKLHERCGSLDTRVQGLPRRMNNDVPPDLRPEEEEEEEDEEDVNDEEVNLSPAVSVEEVDDI